MDDYMNSLTLQNVERVFRWAMEHGWSSGELATGSLPLMPGYKCIYMVVGKFRVIDAFTAASRNGKSSGFTTIWFDSVPVWTMNYKGYYPKDVIPFLKLALQKATAERIFTGGRGPWRFTHEDFPGLDYCNEAGEGRYSFSVFSGREEIYKGNCPVGYHEYSGMSLI